MQYVDKLDKVSFLMQEDSNRKLPQSFKEAVKIKSSYKMLRKILFELQPT
jgi:hypothetical protein